jgi:hypothetical protein
MHPDYSSFSSGLSNGHIDTGIEGPHGSMRQSSPLDWNEALDIINNATSSEQVCNFTDIITNCPCLSF